MARGDLGGLIAEAAAHGLYGNLITSGTLGGEREIVSFAAAGLRHVQLSFQDVEPINNDRIAGLAGAYARKTAFAAAGGGARPPPPHQAGGARPKLRRGAPVSPDGG